MSKYSYQEDLKKQWPAFEIMWRETLSLFPEVPLDGKERDELKKFTEKVYNHILDIKSIAGVVSGAYDDGYDQGLEDGEPED